MDAATLGVWLLSEYGYPWGNSVLVTLLHTLAAFRERKEIDTKSVQRVES